MIDPKNIYWLVGSASWLVHCLILFGIYWEIKKFLSVIKKEMEIEP